MAAVLVRKSNPMDNLTYLRRQNRELAVRDRLHWVAMVLFGIGLWLALVG